MEASFRIVQIVILVGMVIFVHELGHFLVARWCGVLVERFSIGFGPVLLSFKRGDTEYAISLIPLGGYVKMLGQTDTPELEEPSDDDERSYQNKSVGQRMAIISAGVIMNVIFGFACFVLAFRLGVLYTPAIIGTLVPGQPAWKEGLRAGDHIVEIEGRRSTDYEMLLTEVMTSKPGNPIQFTVDRAGKEMSFSITPEQKQLKPQIGVLPSSGLTLFSDEPAAPNSPAARANNPQFEGEDRVLAVDGEPVDSYWQFAQKMFERQDQPVTITVARHTGDDDQTAETADIIVEPNHVRRIGLHMDIGEIVAIQKGSPAERAVDKQGNPSPIQPKKDFIKAVDGESDIDPLRLPDVIAEKAKAGEQVTLTLLRKGKEQKEIDVVVTPEVVPSWIDFTELGPNLDDQPMSIPSLGIAYRILPTVKAVVERSPAATAKRPLQKGDIIKSATFFTEFRGEAKEIKVEIQQDQWPATFWTLQFPEVRKVNLTIARGTETFAVTLQPTPDPQWSMWHRGMRFRSVFRERYEPTIAGAVKAGMAKTKISILRLYSFLRGLVITRSISPKFLAGPIRIAAVAYDVSEDFALLILFVGSLSIHLAVINFLPIPVLDGGHMVMLTYELFMRRKPSERIAIFAPYVGLLLILSLLIYVTFGDISWLTAR